MLAKRIVPILAISAQLARPALAKGPANGKLAAQARLFENDGADAVIAAAALMLASPPISDLKRYLGSTGIMVRGTS